MISINSKKQISIYSNLDETITSLNDFSPEHLVRCVSKCVRLIQPDIDVPESLPPGIAQRYNVTTALAEACAVSYFFPFISRDRKSVQ